MDRDHVSELLPARFVPMVRGAEELRLRRGAPPGVVRGAVEYRQSAAPVSCGEIDGILNRACRGSLHSFDRELAAGFVTARGGVRIGVCGTAGREGGALREISSLCIRFPRQIADCGGETAESAARSRESVLIIAPPGLGKTTLLRELVRKTASLGRRVAVCDERNELAAMSGGEPGFCLGTGTDILCSVGKREGIMMLLRAMSPQVIAVDEISDAGDIAAVIHAAHCGVRLFATAHAENADDLRRRPIYRELMEDRVFTRGIIISLTGGERRYEAVAL